MVDPIVAESGIQFAGTLRVIIVGIVVSRPSPTPEFVALRR
jgi:hypothetical protein